MFVYDIIELTITAENQLNLEHDDQNREYQWWAGMIGRKHKKRDEALL